MVLDDSLDARRARVKSPRQFDRDGLPFVVEIWAADDVGAKIVVAQARNLVLARTACAAALAEHAGRRITIRRGDLTLVDSHSSTG